MIEDAAILYLEGYLWDPEERAAMRAVIEAARKAGLGRLHLVRRVHRSPPL